MNGCIITNLEVISVDGVLCLCVRWQEKNGLRLREWFGVGCALILRLNLVGFIQTYFWCSCNARLMYTRISHGRVGVTDERWLHDHKITAVSSDRHVPGEQVYHNPQLLLKFEKVTNIDWQCLFCQVQMACLATILTTATVSLTKSSREGSNQMSPASNASK